MAVREAERLLNEHHFKFVRKVRHGEMWVGQQGQLILVGRDVDTGRNLKNLKATIKRLCRSLDTSPIRESSQITKTPVEKPESTPDMIELNPKTLMAKTQEEIAEPEFGENGEPKLKRLIRTPVDVRLERGKILFAELKNRNWPLLSREDVVDLFTFADYSSPQNAVRRIVAGEVESVGFLSDRQTGEVMFESRDIFALIKTKAQRYDNDQELKNTPTPEPQVTKPQEPITLSTNALVLPPLPKEIMEFYGSLARKHNTTTPKILVKIIQRHFESESKKIQAQYEAEMAKVRERLLDEIDVDLD